MFTTYLSRDQYIITLPAFGPLPVDSCVPIGSLCCSFLLLRNPEPVPQTKQGAESESERNTYCPYSCFWIIIYNSAADK